MTDAQLEVLKQRLAQDFVPHLVPLLDQNKPADHLATKNVARAFSGFTIQKITKVDGVTAAKAVVDDYEDNGLDAIHYHQPSKKLFLVQAKLRADEPFGQDEANAFCRGVNDLVNQRYDRFNQNVRNRQPELESALDEATEIVLVVGHIGAVVSDHAKDALSDFLNDPETPDERLRDTWVDFGPGQVVEHLLAEQASAPVNADIVIYGEKRIDGPRLTYYGQISVAELAALYRIHQNALLEKNIRFFLGIGDSDVNKAIHGSLEQSPAEFFYLSNGVTAVANMIQPKAVGADGGRKFTIQGLSVINGAQTIASCHHFITTHPQADVSAARVLLTLIQVDQADAFGARVTKARNHQNPVSLAQFAALDDVQERLRRELAFDNIVYRYRPEVRQATPGVDAITIDDAAYALALFHPDPGFPVTLKKQPASLLDTKGADYPRLFNPALSGRKLANAVRLYRQALVSLGGNELAAGGAEKLIYRHGRYTILWLALQSNRAWLDHNGVRTPLEAGNLVSHPLDLWRERVRAEAVTDLVAANKGPLAFFRNLTNARPFVVKLRDAGV